MKKTAGKLLAAVFAAALAVSAAVSVPASAEFVKNKNGTVSYCDKNGKQVKNKWIVENGSRYYIKADGTMAVSVRMKIGGKYYFFGKDGKMVKNKWVNVNNVKYYFTKNGTMAVNRTMKIGGKTYVFDKNGRSKVKAEAASGTAAKPSGGASGNKPAGTAAVNKSSLWSKHFIMPSAGTRNSDVAAALENSEYIDYDISSLENITYTDELAITGFENRKAVFSMKFNGVKDGSLYECSFKAECTEKEFSEFMAYFRKVLGKTSTASNSVGVPSFRWNNAKTKEIYRASYSNGHIVFMYTKSNV